MLPQFTCIDTTPDIESQLPVAESPEDIISHLQEVAIDEIADSRFLSGCPQYQQRQYVRERVRELLEF